jgi:polysaccharide biosynthesis/export protein
LGKHFCFKEESPLRFRAAGIFYRKRTQGWVMRILLALLFLCGFGTISMAQTLKSGDNLSISVLQDPKLDRQVVVDPSGQISFPLAGHIRARGLTPQAVENEIKNRLKSNYKDENLDVTVAFLSTSKPDIPEEDLKPRFFITGEVIRPGSYTVRQRTTLMQAISLAGGLGPYAAKRRLQVRRQVGGDETIFVFDYRAYEAGVDLEGNITLRAGDVIVVPERGLFE